MSSNTSNAYTVRLPGCRRYFGSASNLGSEMRLCAGSNSGGKFVFNADIAPNFSMSFDARVPNWSANSFKYGIHSELQSFYFACPSNSQLQMQDVNFTPLTNFTLNPSYLLSNGVYNSFNIVNRGSNLIATVNGYPYVAKVPNYRYILNSWPNSTFSFSACNSGPITGSNSIRRLHAQSITSFSDPIIANNSITAQLVNSGKIGTTELQSRVIDTQVSFTDYAFTSNLFCTSNTALSNVAASNVVVRRNMTASNITASNLTVNSFTASNATFSNVIATGSFPVLNADRVNVNNVLHMKNQVQNCTISLYSANPNATPSNADTNYLGFGVNNGMLRYNVNNAADNHVFYRATTELARITGTGRVGVGTSNPAYTLDVTGSSRISSNILVGSNVGVGTVSPAFNLDVTGTARFTDNVYFDANSYWGGSIAMTNNTIFMKPFGDGTCYIKYSSTPDGMEIAGFQGGRLCTTQGGFLTEVMRWNYANVGIGTATPGAKLHVAGNAKVHGPLFFNNQIQTCLLSLFNGNATPGSSDTNYIGFGISGGQFRYHADTTTSHVFYSNTTELMRVAPGGNVGIGQTSPSYKLDVNGSARMTGNVVCNTVDSQLATTLYAQVGTYTGSSFKCGPDGTPFSTMWSYTASIAAYGSGPITLTVTFGFTMPYLYNMFCQPRDIGVSPPSDQYVTKITAMSSTGYECRITRVDTGSSGAGWTRPWQLQFLMFAIA